MGEQIVVPIFLFGGTAAVLWKYFDTRHKERMSIIEKGLVKEDLKYLYTRRGMRKTDPFSSLKWGMLAVFVGLGILVSAFVSQFMWGHEEQITTGIIFLSGGLGLVTFYLIARKKTDHEEHQEPS